MKYLPLVLLIMFSGLQYKLWLGDSGYLRLTRLDAEIVSQKQGNGELEQQNAQLSAEVKGLKQSLEAVEERARAELGMIRRGETFVQVIEPDSE
ncbi:cell division protein FtsB [Pelagibaculum spongiae]|uniref:Cell division protein FtsB n=1 Tax=Pelagibaculum spongiae TaxID=2080658 RepID=A0A2V1GPR5_9GAMM|nr:cell division protein FtsB [Pelagibaculum spongiae]PVZ64891.1 cell division protein FtsB [Pelagibaculum spongiae]